MIIPDFHSVCARCVDDRFGERVFQVLTDRKCVRCGGTRGTRLVPGRSWAPDPPPGSRFAILVRP